MKNILKLWFLILISGLLFISNTGLAQDTLYIYKSGEVITKQAVADVDSIIFYQPKIENTLKDYDGNVYKTITIGTQTWMAENLKTTRYFNGDLIETTFPITLDITGDNNPKYQWSYDGDNNNSDIYGKLYTWSAIADNRNVCPAGWHVPADSEWTVLTDFLGGEGVAGGKLKETGFKHWNDPNTEASNQSGFYALPGGYRSGGDFYFLGNYGTWWSLSESDPYGAWSRYMFNNLNEIARINCVKSNGFSVRCLRD